MLAQEAGPLGVALWQRLRAFANYAADALSSYTSVTDRRLALISVFPRNVHLAIRLQPTDLFDGRTE
jgi:hypothetical protein